MPFPQADRASIHNLEAVVDSLSAPDRALFHRFFDTRREDLAPNHAVTRVRNRWLGDATSFDQRRRRRAPSAEAIEPLHRRCESEPDCCFCGAPGRAHMLTHPEAGRIGTCTFFAPKVRFSRWHCLLVPDEHNPLSTNEATLHDLFACGAEWAAQVVEQARRSGTTPTPRHYFMAWNILCGSLVHSHSQATVSAQFAEGGVQQLLERACDYRLRFNSSLFADFARLHESLGLACTLERSTAFASITPLQQNEVWLLSDSAEPGQLPADALRLLRIVLDELLRQSAGPCPALNIAVAFPPLWQGDETTDPPILIRIVDRGWPWLGVTDWATMEMFGTRVVAGDPFELAGGLRRAASAGTTG